MAHFDLRAAMQAARLWLALNALDSEPDEYRLARLEWLLYQATDGFQLGKLAALFPAILDAVTPDPRYQDAALEQQREGALAGVDRRAILRGAAAGALAAAAPGAFLPASYLPELQGRDRLVLGLLLFATDVSTRAASDSGADESTTLTSLEVRRLALAAGAACECEIRDRLAKHPTSKAVWDLVNGDDPTALQRLVNLIDANARNLPRDREDSLSSAESTLWLAIQKHVDRAGSIAGFTGNNDPTDPSTRAYLVLYLAMAGELDYLPVEVRRDWIDELREQSAQKRGGDGERRPILKALSTAIEEGCVASWEMIIPMPVVVGPQPEVTAQPRRRDRNTADPSRCSHARDDAWRTLTYQQESEAFAQSLDVRRASLRGNERRFVDWCMEHAEDDEPLRWKQIAEQLGFTDRTLLNVRTRLQSKRPI
jgi:hypothetical protein